MTEIHNYLHESGDDTVPHEAITHAIRNLLEAARYMIDRNWAGDKALTVALAVIDGSLSSLDEFLGPLSEKDVKRIRATAFELFRELQ